MITIVNNVEEYWHQTSSAKSTAEVTENLRRFIDDSAHDEIDIQEHIEKNTELFYLPELKNHGLHFNSIISKMPIGSEFCDYAYLTKSSDQWRLVLVELESPRKQIFQRTAANGIEFTQGFNHAYGQILKWRRIYSKNPFDILGRLSPIRKPLSDNDIEIRYCLVIGRRSEYENSQEKRDLFVRFGVDSDVNIMSWDSYISGLSNQKPAKRAILAAERHGFRMKHMHGRPGNIFGWVSEAELHLTKLQEDELRADGYDIESWRGGKLLNLNGKKALSASDPLAMFQGMAIVETQEFHLSIR